MNKNGFTLVELIAVIVILGLLALIANSSVVNVVKNSKSDLYNTQLELIESAAETWGNDNLDKLPNDGECKYLTLANLKNYGLMEEIIINPKTNKEFSDDLYIKITSKINSSGVLKTSYKVDDSVNGCTEALPPVCTLALDSEKTGLDNGAKYNCKVKETMEVEYPNGYTFYVLGKNEDGTINLIMNQNIYSDGTPAGMIGVSQIENNILYSLVAWINKDDYLLVGGSEEYWELQDTNNNKNTYGAVDKGPITALKFLEIATNSWSNLNSMVINKFTDEKGAKYNMQEIELKARLPYYSEVSDKTDNNLYLYENLDPNHATSTHGYWLLSINTLSLTSAGYVDESGYSNSYPWPYEYTFVGVRPVITLHDYQIR